MNGSNMTTTSVLKSRVYPISYHQQGATLIVVLLILILIMLVGTIAVRRSITSLKLATSDQISTVLLQSADGANIQLEQMVNGDPTKTSYQTAIIEKNGIFSYFLDNPQNVNDELVYCYNPRALQTLTNKTTIFKGTGTVFDNGRCDATKADSYTSGRQTTMTQVSIRPFVPTPSATDIGFTTAITGNDINNSANTSNFNRQGKTSFTVRSLSAIPAYNDVGSCYGVSHHGVNDKTNTLNVTKCLRDAGVPSKELHQRLDIEYQKDAIDCVSAGKGSGMSTECSKYF